MPLFKRTPAGDAEGFVATVAASAVAENQMTVVRIAGKKLILTRHDGRVYAIDSTCPHAAADLSAGTLRAWRLCCGEHDYCFDIRTGLLVWPDDEPYRLRRYEVKEEDGVVMVRPAR